jgi:hypothetical protein
MQGMRGLARRAVAVTNVGTRLPPRDFMRRTIALFECHHAARGFRAGGISS